MDPHTTSNGREQCLRARDEYYACVTEAAAPSADAPARRPCPELRKDLERLCLASHIRYWDDRVKHGRPLLSVGKSG
jgi:Cytochrome oxidase c subunit VIb